MRWIAEERLKRALPYGVWRWRDGDGRLVETLFNRRYRPIATRVDGQLIDRLVEPPVKPMPAAEYYYGCGTNSPQNGYPYHSRPGLPASSVQQKCREVLVAWGLDPAEHEATVAAELREERRAARAINRQRLGLGWRRSR